MWSSGPISHGQFSGKAWREQVITRQPAAEKRFTVAWPMPRLAPVSSSVRRGWLVLEFGISALTDTCRTLGPRLAQRRAAELDAVVQAERPVVPELDRDRHDAVAGPVRRARHGAERVFRRVERDRLLEGEPAFQRARLLARPGADLRALRAGREIGVGLLRRHALDRPAHAHLPVRAISSRTAARPSDWRQARGPCCSRCWCRTRSRARRRP